MPTYRKNISDKDQTVFETAAFEDSSAVFINDATRILAKGQGATERVAHASATINSNAGVIMSDSDKPGKFTEETIGKA